MPHIDTRAASAVALTLILLAAVGLSACGGSSVTSSTASSTTSSTASTGSTRSGRFATLRECLQKEGITLPKRGAPGQRPGGPDGLLGGGGGGGGAPQLPKGVTRAQLQAALKKCGGPAGGGRFAGAKARLGSPTFKAALVKFATCMQGSGVKLPAPNTSGKGPIFDTHGLNTASTTFRTAAAKCTGFLRGAFPRAGGAAK